MTATPATLPSGRALHPSSVPGAARAPTGATHPRLPPQWAQLLQRLPPYPGSLLLVAALNLALARQLSPDVAQHLDGKRFGILVRDAGLRFDFVWQGQLFLPRAPHSAPDLLLSADAYDLLRLAQGLDDPDTLFFSRRLSMQGDTELGLVVKNALDAIERPAWSRAPAAALTRLLERLPCLRARAGVRQP